MAEKLDFAELERECQAAVAFSEVADCYQRDILQLIARIRELEAEQERASQPGGGELDLPGLRVAIRAFTPHMHDWISKVIDALERQPGSGEDTERAAFEAEMVRMFGSSYGAKVTELRADKQYRNGFMRDAWLVWQARASLDGRS